MHKHNQSLSCWNRSLNCDWLGDWPRPSWAKQLHWRLVKPICQRCCASELEFSTFFSSLLSLVFFFLFFLFFVSFSCSFPFTSVSSLLFLSTFLFHLLICSLFPFSIRFYFFFYFLSTFFFLFNLLFSFSSISLLFPFPYPASAFFFFFLSFSLLFYLSMFCFFSPSSSFRSSPPCFSIYLSISSLPFLLQFLHLLLCPIVLLFLPLPPHPTPPPLSPPRPPALPLPPLLPPRWAFPTLWGSRQTLLTDVDGWRDEWRDDGSTGSSSSSRLQRRRKAYSSLAGPPSAGTRLLLLAGEATFNHGGCGSRGETSGTVGSGEHPSSSRSTTERNNKHLKSRCRYSRHTCGRLVSAILGGTRHSLKAWRGESNQQPFTFDCENFDHGTDSGSAVSSEDQYYWPTNIISC